jgi:hypothetical protein
MTTLNLHRAILGIVGFGLAVLMVGALVYGKSSTAEAQDTISLDRRISMVEQRLYGIESNMRLLQQQLEIRPRSPQPSTEQGPELELLQRQILILQRQVDDLKCGVIRLDERTLPTVKTSRTAPVARVDPCRADADSPLSFSIRR